jgi:hypothetical protein
MHAEQGPLIPLLSADEIGADPDVLSTWHAALSNTLGVEVPHDLLALWLYPANGGVALLGPAELAQDDLRVPRPAPHVPQDQLFQLEERVRTAGYASAVALPIRFGGRDVGLMLLADLRPGRYGPEQAMLLQGVAARLASTFERLARQWSIGQAADGTDANAMETLLDGLTAALAHGGTPRDFTRMLSSAIGPFLPHEQLELLVGSGATERSYRLGAHGDGPPWTHRDLFIEPEQLDLAQLFGDGATVIVADSRRLERWDREVLRTADARDLRSLVGVRLMRGGRTLGHLLAGSIGAGLYGMDDAVLLARIAPVVAAQVEAIVLEWEAQSLRAQAGAARAVPQQLRRMSELLAERASGAATLREFAAEATALLPFYRMRFALRLGDETRVAMVVPGEERALADLPQIPVGGTSIARVLSGELPNAVAGGAAEIDLVFPLRVARQITGAMVLTTGGREDFGRAHLVLAQQVADLVAPHLELLRRAALLPPPFAPGWKRAPQL